MTIPSQEELEEAIIEATRNAAVDLFLHHPENFYYFALITTGAGHAPFVSAWSDEALKAASSDAMDQSELKWSYADSPYCCYGESHFRKVNELFLRRPAADESDTINKPDDEWAIRLAAMESALRKLDNEGVFGTGAERQKIVINAEVMPPDITNRERATRLNPPEALITWLAEAAE